MMASDERFEHLFNKHQVDLHSSRNDRRREALPSNARGLEKSLLVWTKAAHPVVDEVADYRRYRRWALRGDSGQVPVTVFLRQTVSVDEVVNENVDEKRHSASPVMHASRDV